MAFDEGEVVLQGLQSMSYLPVWDIDDVGFGSDIPNLGRYSKDWWYQTYQWMGRRPVAGCESGWQQQPSAAVKACLNALVRAPIRSAFVALHWSDTPKEDVDMAGMTESYASEAVERFFNDAGAAMGTATPLEVVASFGPVQVPIPEVTNASQLTGITTGSGWMYEATDGTHTWWTGFDPRTERYCNEPWFNIRWHPTINISEAAIPGYDPEDYHFTVFTFWKRTTCGHRISDIWGLSITSSDFWIGGEHYRDQNFILQSAADSGLRWSGREPDPLVLQQPPEDWVDPLGVIDRYTATTNLHEIGHQLVRV